MVLKLFLGSKKKKLKAFLAIEASIAIIILGMLFTTYMKLLLFTNKIFEKKLEKNNEISNIEESNFNSEKKYKIFKQLYIDNVEDFLQAIEVNMHADVLVEKGIFLEENLNCIFFSLKEENGFQPFICICSESKDEINSIEKCFKEERKSVKVNVNLQSKKKQYRKILVEILNSYSNCIYKFYHL